MVGYNTKNPQFESSHGRILFILTVFKQIFIEKNEYIVLDHLLEFTNTLAASMLVHIF